MIPAIFMLLLTCGMSMLASIYLKILKLSGAQVKIVCINATK